MRYIITLLIVLLFIPLIHSNTTFSDNDDIFIRSNPITGEVIITEEQDVNSGGSCLYKWNCTNWGECLSSKKQIRNCINIGTCPDTYKTPEIEQNCTYIPSQKNAKEDKILGIKKTEENKNKENFFIYFILILVIVLISVYLKRDYIKKLIKKRT